MTMTILIWGGKNTAAVDPFYSKVVVVSRKIFCSFQRARQRVIKPDRRGSRPLHEDRRDTHTHCWKLV